MPISTEERNYLKNKHRGGLNNSKGAVYENFYATYQIALLMNQYLSQLNEIYLTSQMEEVFVDDLLIRNLDTLLIYHQIKDVKGLTWAYGESHSLLFDFTRQKEISMEKNERFCLKLVFSDLKSSVCKIPTEIEECTIVEYFPACTSINELILSHSSFKNAIQNIAIQEEVEDDELSGIASAILGAWCSVRQKNISLQQILDITYSKGKGFINIKTYPTIKISEVCKDILTRFELSFYTNGSTLYWSYHRLKGETIWTKELEFKLENADISNIWDLMEILS